MRLQTCKPQAADSSDLADPEGITPAKRGGIDARESDGRTERERERGRMLQWRERRREEVYRKSLLMASLSFLVERKREEGGEDLDKTGNASCGKLLISGSMNYEEMTMIFI
ncbi:hypothetical protein CRG98_002257 [Punica granatum]|uniref:Uncharacterized protein n=1 Tax=Punica granatum TaxID=22663 RepID=A0A2I0L9E2_PUNGR|nr:hypothetical protein CRG98_002257 [Punica granatum]